MKKAWLWVGVVIAALATFLVGVVVSMTLRYALFGMRRLEGMASALEMAFWLLPLLLAWIVGQKGHHRLFHGRLEDEGHRPTEVAVDASINHPLQISVLSQSLLQTVLPLLGGVVAVELLLNRGFSRTGVFLAKTGVPSEVYDVLTAIGGFSFNLASLLSLLAWVLFIGWGKRDTVLAISPSLRWFGIVFLGLNLMSPVFAADPAFSILYQTVLLTFLMGLVGTHWFHSGSRGTKLGVLFPGLVFMVYVIGGWQTRLTNLLEMAPLPLSFLPFLGETLAVVGAPLLFIAYGQRPPPRSLAMAFVLVVLFTGVFWVFPAFVSMLAMWTLGFGLFLPFPLYSLALFFVTLTLLHPRPGMRHEQRLGLVLILCGGIAIATTYQQLLATLGLLLLAHRSPGLQRQDRRAEQGARVRAPQAST